MLHLVAIRYVTLWYITLLYISLSYIALSYDTLQYLKLHYVKLHYVMLCYGILRNAILCYTMLHCITSQYAMLCYLKLRYAMLHYVKHSLWSILSMLFLFFCPSQTARNCLFNDRYVLLTAIYEMNNMRLYLKFKDQLIKLATNQILLLNATQLTFNVIISSPFYWLMCCILEKNQFFSSNKTKLLGVQKCVGTDMYCMDYLHWKKIPPVKLRVVYYVVFLYWRKYFTVLQIETPTPLVARLK